MKLSWYEDRRLRLLAEYVAGAKVLDLGNAQLPNPYLRRFGAESVTGMDIARVSGLPGYDEQLCGDVSELASELEGRRFDVVIAGELLEHLEEPYAFLRQVRGALEKNGRLVLSTPNPIAIPVLFAEIFMTRRWFYTTDHVYYFLPRWVVRMLERTGYRVHEVRPVGVWFPWPRIRACPISLSYQVIYVAEPA